VPQNKQKFFGIGIDYDDLPDLAEVAWAVAGGLHDRRTRQDAADKRAKQLLHYLDLSMDPKMGQEAAVDIFSAELRTILL